MSARSPADALEAVAQKWRALAERRRAHFVELYDSGRWKHYYNETQFLCRLREAIRLTPGRMKQRPTRLSCLSTDIVRQPETVRPTSIATPQPRRCRN